jgi:hypothetical protein
MDPLNPPSASNTNPVRNGYLRRSKWNGILCAIFQSSNQTYDWKILLNFL